MCKVFEPAIMQVQSFAQPVKQVRHLLQVTETRNLIPLLQIPQTPETNAALLAELHRRDAAGDEDAGTLLRRIAAHRESPP